MIDFTIEKQIARTPDEVFDYITDPEKLANWQTNTISAVNETPGPLKLGSRLREVHRASGGKELESLVEVSEFEPGRVFALRVIEGIPVHLRVTLEPGAGATTMRFRAHGQLAGAMRLATPVLQRTLRRQFTKQCQTLKELLESGS